MPLSPDVRITHTGDAHIKDELSPLRQQEATARTISAALAAGKAIRARNATEAVKHDHEALERYRLALEIQDNNNDVVAAEGKAFHLLRLNRLEFADEAFAVLETIAKDLEDPAQKSIVAGRAKRYRALIAQAWTVGRSDTAWSMLLSALSLRQPYADGFKNWEAIEQGDLHYVSAYVASCASYVLKEPDHLATANSYYERVKGSLPNSRLQMTSAQRRLHTAVNEGLTRLERARITNGTKAYDLDWLFQPVSPPSPPPSNNPQEPPKPVS